MNRQSVARRPAAHRLLAVLLGLVLAGAAWMVVSRVLPHLVTRPEIRGAVRVVDGDTLVVDGVRVRIRGIDAPETRQVCRRGSEEWRCGVEAGERLRDLIRGEAVACTDTGRDRNGRTLGRCRAGRELDLGARLVRDGWAVSYDATYLAEESEARLARRGIWASEFERPREWRRAHRGAPD